MQQMKEDLRNHFQDMYYRVMGEMNRLLQRAKLHTISELQEDNPSYAQMAENLSTIADIMDKLAPVISAEYEVCKLREYVAQVNQLARAIEAGDVGKYEDAVAILDRRPFL